jgi:hypothetical protein
LYRVGTRCIPDTLHTRRPDFPQTEKLIGNDAANEYLVAAGCKHYRIPEVL